MGSTVEGEMSATIPSDISVMMDVDLRRHHEQSGAWSKKGVCSIDGGKRKRKNEFNTTVKSVGGENKTIDPPRGEPTLAENRSALGVTERKSDKRRRGDSRTSHGSDEEDGSEESAQEEELDGSVNDREREAGGPFFNDETYEEAGSEVWRDNNEAGEAIDSDEITADVATEDDATTGGRGMGMGGGTADSGTAYGADENVSWHETSSGGELAEICSTGVGVGRKGKKRNISRRR